MRKNITVAMAASLAVLAVTAAPIAASGEPGMAPGTAKAAAPEKKDSMASWPAEKQAAYKAWPDETKAYYWTLSEKRQKMFWGLSDPDKVALSTMSPPDQAKAWDRIEGRTGGADARR